MVSPFEFSLGDSPLNEFSRETAVEGLKLIVDQEDSDLSKLIESSSFLQADALKFIVEIYKKSLSFPITLENVILNREAQRSQKDFQITTAPEWKAKDCDVEFRPSILVQSPQSIDTSISNDVDFIADFHSSPYSLSFYLSSLSNIIQKDNVHLLLESLNLFNFHFQYNGKPIPSHLITLCLSLLNNKQKSQVICIPSLESKEEATYLSCLFKEIHNSLKQENVIKTVMVIDNIYNLVHFDCISFEFRDSLVGIILQPEQCYVSSSQLFYHEQSGCYNSIKDYVLSICSQRNILPIAYGCYSFASSQMKSKTSQISKEELLKDIENARNEGWNSSIIRNPNHLSLLTNSSLPNRNNVSGDNTPFSQLLQSNDKTTQSITFEDLEEDFFYCLQFLAVFFTGSYDLEFKSRDGVLLSDAHVFEYCRKKVQQYIQNSINITLKSGQTLPLSEKIGNELLGEVFHRICHNVGGVQVERTLETKIAYDDSYSLMKKVLKSSETIEHFSNYAHWHFISPFINNPARLQKCLLANQNPYFKYPNICIGGSIIFTTNESFAPAISLCKPNFPSFRPKSFGPAGQVFDGWETRRHNMFPPDYVTIKLAKPSRIYGVNIDTAHFSGNAGQGASVQGLAIKLRHNRYQEEWVSLVDEVVINENDRNYFPTKQQPLVQYVRLNQYPDGGIARLELFGESVDCTIQELTENSVDDVWKEKVRHYFSLIPKETGFPNDFIPPYSDVSLLGKPDVSTPCSDDPPMLLFPDLYDYGGADASVIAGSNTQYSIPSNVLRPGRGINMGDGWETSRMRLPVKEDIFKLDTCVYQFCNWAVIRLNQKGSIHKIVLDTFHFKNNSPQAVAIEGTDYPDVTLDNYYSSDVVWKSIFPPTGVVAHQEQAFDIDNSLHDKQWTHVLIKIYPCGGLSRVRLYGPKP